MVSITRSCPNGHVEYEYQGGHELQDDEEFVRETAIPDGDPKCVVCGDELEETVEDGGAMSGTSASGSYRFPDLDAEDVFHLQQLEKYHGKEQVIGWLRGKTAIPLRYQFEEGFDEDDYFEAMRERYVDTATAREERGRDA